MFLYFLYIYKHSTKVTKGVTLKKSTCISVCHVSNSGVDHHNYVDLDISKMRENNIGYYYRCLDLDKKVFSLMSLNQ